MRTSEREHLFFGEKKTSPRGPSSSGPLLLLLSLRPRRLFRSLTPSRGLLPNELPNLPTNIQQIKPDGVQRGLVGEIIGRFERKGFKLTALKFFTPPRSLAEEHYKDLSAKPFFGDLVSYICSGPVVAMVWEGAGVVASARKLIGATNPLAAEPGTIRGDHAIVTGRNVIHGSDSPENGERETALWFGPGDACVSWERAVEPWLVE